MKITGMISCEQCGNYIDGVCNDSDLNTRLDYNKYGVSIGKRCSKFLAKRQSFGVYSSWYTRVRDGQWKHR